MISEEVWRKLMRDIHEDTARFFASPEGKAYMEKNGPEYDLVFSQPRETDITGYPK